MKIFSIAVNIHDHNYYDSEHHYMAERFTRRKHNLNRENSHDPTYSRDFFKEFFIPNYKNKDQVFAFTVSNLGQQFVRDMLEDTIGNLDFLEFKPEHLWDFYQTKDCYYIDHHQSHAAYTFLTSGFEESDILAIDGRGWKFNCIFVDSKGIIHDLSDKLSIGGLWNRLSQDIGLGYLGAGKTMGLAGYGSYNNEIHTMIDQYMANPNHRLPDGSKDILNRVSKENVAYTLQIYTENLIKEYVYPLKSSNNLCVAGGVAYNGYVNEMFLKHYNNVHVPPAAGDEGQALGTYMHADYILNKNTKSVSVYAGREYEVNESIFAGLDYEQKSMNEIYQEIAQAIADGFIVGWFQGRSESGNRALGNRSILADPRNPNIKDIINSRIKKREDFRPFAPSVLEEYYKKYFNTSQPSPYMSRIVPVISNDIPGVTHIDGTARIQTVTKEFNEKYYNLIHEFYKITGVPILLNTSFNCQEPIVETPQDAIHTFKKCGLDILVINDIIIRKTA